MGVEAYNINIYGLVQGVGFRPFIYRLANEMGLPGSVENCSDGVDIKLKCTQTELHKFIERVKNEAPEISIISDIKVSETIIDDTQDFRINGSHLSSGSTQVSPDIAICSQCLKDRENQTHRIDYPFINCTYCGPRFSIISRLPYDRNHTSMQPFKMCDKCANEYSTPEDRRFHAQPVACNSCGPQYYIATEDGTPPYRVVLNRIIESLERGEIVALKSMGGYNLICDALNDTTVEALRRMKQRPRKPFAIMVESTESAQSFAHINDAEIGALESWHRPIVVLNLKENRFAKHLAPLYRTIGVMLPYMAIHYDIFRHSQLKSLVITSGNQMGEPIMIDDNEARKFFPSLGLLTVTYNRDIYNRIDDSVVRYSGGKIRMMRRARGYIPTPLFHDMTVDGIIGCGAEVISQFAIGSANKIIQSQYLGNTSRLANEELYRDSLDKFKELFNILPRKVVTDLHPNYRTSIIGKEIAKEYNAQLVTIQHHHAHAVAVMAEYGLKDNVVAMVLDGTGLGTDGNIWGGEILICNRISFKRCYNSPYLPMPGGDIAAKETWRMAVALVKTHLGSIDNLPPLFIDRIGMERIRIICNMINTHTNCPLTSGVGRLFDAVSSLLGITDFNSYEAEAPILLEQIADTSITDPYDANDWVKELISDINDKIPVSHIASRFHTTLAHIFAKQAISIAQKNNIHDIVLCGGVMQNTLLVNLIETQLKSENLNIFIPQILPPNDGAISVGQIAHGAELQL